MNSLRLGFGAAWLVTAGCAAPAVVPGVERPVVVQPTPTATGPSAAEEARAVAERFVAAAEARDFATVFSLLAGPLRDRYTPQRLEQDFDREPLAQERLARVRAALAAGVTVTDLRATLPLGATKAMTLVRESVGWRVASFE